MSETTSSPSAEPGAAVACAVSRNPQLGLRIGDATKRTLLDVATRRLPPLTTPGRLSGFARRAAHVGFWNKADMAITLGDVDLT